MASAKGLGVTFHRAVDVSRDPLHTLEQIIDLGCERVLSSGGRARASDGVQLLREMVQRAGNRIIVMPGAGVDAENIGAIRNATGANEFHASARVALPSLSRHRGDPALGMEGGEWRTDAEAVRRIVAALR
jgi:copper homeostasis protein